jgi:hypothetical protein
MTMHPEQLGCAINHFSAPHFSAFLIYVISLRPKAALV